MEKMRLILIFSLLLCLLCGCKKDENLNYKLTLNSEVEQDILSEDFLDDVKNDQSGRLVDIFMEIKESDESIFRYAEVKGGVLVLGLRESAEFVFIPEEINSRKVIEINQKAFAGYNNIKAVRIPPSVKKIGQGAFKDCEELEVFVSGDKLEEIGIEAFSGCKKLHTVKLNEGLKSIHSLAFAGTDIKTIEIPDSVEYFSCPFSQRKDGKKITVFASVGSEAEKFINQSGYIYNLSFEIK